MAQSPHRDQASQDPSSMGTNVETNTSSRPASLTSAANSSYQLSPLHPNAASDLDLIRRHSGTTISTSLSNKSSQEGTDTPDLVKSDVSAVAQDKNINCMLTDDVLDKDYINAPKRMADGEVKPSKSSSPTSPVESSKYVHSRNSSRTSQVSQIGELSNQLQTRLSYAMVKVQNGWQVHNISELEQMTIGKASPVFAASDAHRLCEHRFPTNLPADHSKFIVQLSEPAAAAPNHTHFSPLNTATTFEQVFEHPLYKNFDRTPRRKVGAAYETFGQDHKASVPSWSIEARNTGPSLAPPANIIARAPPPLRTHDLDTTSGPVSPTPIKESKIRTLSQQAEFEKDAVETLLFMSSPGNSDHHPPRACARTPLRNRFAHQTAQTDVLDFSKLDEACGCCKQPGLSCPRYLRSPTRKRPLSNAEMDKMLDETSDASSNDDGEWQG